MRDVDKKLEYWQTHREVTTNFIVERASALENNNGTMAIFGAGRCNDLDIKEVLKYVKKLYLLDIEVSHIEEGLKNQNLNDDERKKIILIGDIDFTGNNENLYEQLEEMLKNKCSAKKIIKFIRNVSNNLDTLKLLEEYENFFSIVVSSGVHSQLFADTFLILEKYSNDYSKKDISNIYKEIIYAYSKGAYEYNNLLLKVLNSNGEILILLDLIEICEEYNTLRFLELIERSIKTGNPTLIDEISKYWLMGSGHADTDIRSRLDEDNVAIFRKENKFKYRFWIWKFSEERAYYIKAYAINKKCFKNSK
ncbi:type I 3-dehydroquinase family protein [Clostridium argentinense CDC 2741]|uniref:Type I 3-dehydroquinase family protein n=2 Tax=Clostridium argentinense TaxID=29341 RepID=A0A0C1QTV7_9CLOT|nr:hypothetical protein [Clostridium argentinense]ARC83172.1 hypothetical protein RSJ17_00550 [Clostridium argentinense]KIE44417.1 type I 3-dehydroquinase family protein [Clostridium argentinense CDC 2741]NFF41416.1 hypothetical protein [Clostridium argentinense]NFP52080.1 hypothetical protein [Clostridium argentinense]NFP74424.1 hypothetical protein [Clostridium argentinense]